MSNIELQEIFNKIVLMDNTFDRIIAIKKFKKTYKQSSFYKQTRMPIFSAYRMFAQEFSGAIIYKIKNMLNPSVLGEFITNALDHVAPDAVEDFVDKIDQAFNMGEIKDSTKELSVLIQQMKN
jgi:hypothetical protein